MFLGYSVCLVEATGMDEVSTKKGQAPGPSGAVDEVDSVANPEGRPGREQG